MLICLPFYSICMKVSQNTTSQVSDGSKEGPLKITGKKTLFLFATMMSVITTGLISFVTDLVNFGFQSSFFAIWLRIFALAAPIAFLSVILVSPRVMKIAGKITDKNGAGEI